MFVVHEDMTIYATRGDAVYFPVEKKQGDMKYQFKPGDIVRFKICEKKNYAKVFLLKDFVVEEETTSVYIFLSRFEMKIGEIINKPVDYWYEVELNPDTTPDTFIGYNEKGPAVFRLFPEAKDVVEGEIPDPEEEGAVSRMVVTFVNEYIGENAEVLVQAAFQKYLEEHPIQDGEDGVGIEAASVDGSGNLVLEFTDGESVTVGRVVGPSGKDGKNGQNGVTFTPQLDAEGNLSWKNNGGLDNPAVVNIRGADGKDGYTPVKGKDYFTEDERMGLVAEMLNERPMANGMTVVKDGSIITLSTILDDGSASTSAITLDANEYPTKVVTNGVECSISWEGFDV